MSATATSDPGPPPVVLPGRPLSALIQPVPRPPRPRPHKRKRPPTRPRKKRSPRTPQQIVRLGPAARLNLYRSGQLTREECVIWAARFPEEVPLLNGELPWIALRSADLD